MQLPIRPIRIVIADDHPFFREGFKFMIKKQRIKEVEIIAEACNGEELIDVVQKSKPDLVVTDIRMPVLNGIEASKVIKKNDPEIQVIALSMFDDENYVMDMLDAGANGYLIKSAANEEVIQAIKIVNRGGHYFSDSTSQKLISRIANSNHNPYKKVKPVKLSHQELIIIKLI